MYLVLIADDERIERQFLRRVIEARPERFRVVGEVENGAKTVEMAAELHPDIVLLDINMPVMNGLEAAKAIKLHAPGTAIVLNSAYAEFTFAQQAIAYDVDAYLVKPADRELILETLDNCLQRRRMRTQPASPSTWPLVRAYPYEQAERLIAGVRRRGHRALRADADALLLYYEANYHNFEHHRLFIINLLLSIGAELQKCGIPPALTALLGEHLYLENISRAESWAEVPAQLREFLDRLCKLLEGCGYSTPSQVEVVADYIDTHFAQSLPLAELAAMVYISPAYLSRRFHQEKKIPLREYITRRRMAEAETLLRASGLPIKQIAEDCGFSSQSYFQKVCRETTGCTPAQLRREAGGKGQ